MISIRQSTAESANEKLDEIKAEPKETNSAWLKRVKASDGVLLLGGASIPHFRIRVAQSHARADLTPSSWSLAGILLDDTKFLSVPLELQGNSSDIAQGNGVQVCNMSDYDDPERFPNIAAIWSLVPPSPVPCTKARWKASATRGIRWMCWRIC